MTDRAFPHGPLQDEEQATYFDYMTRATDRLRSFTRSPAEMRRSAPTEFAAWVRAYTAAYGCHPDHLPQRKGDRPMTTVTDTQYAYLEALGRAYRAEHPERIAYMVNGKCPERPNSAIMLLRRLERMGLAEEHRGKWEISEAGMAFLHPRPEVVTGWYSIDGETCVAFYRKSPLGESVKSIKGHVYIRREGCTRAEAAAFAVERLGWPVTVDDVEAIGIGVQADPGWYVHHNINITDHLGRPVSKGFR